MHRPRPLYIATLGLNRSTGGTWKALLLNALPYLLFNTAWTCSLLGFTATTIWLKYPQVHVCCSLLNRWVIWLKEFQNTCNYHPSTPDHSISFKELARIVHMHPSAGYYLVLNRIIASKWMHMNKYILASRQVSVLTLWTLVDNEGVVRRLMDDNCVFGSVQWTLTLQ